MWGQKYFSEIYPFNEFYQKQSENRQTITNAEMLEENRGEHIEFADLAQMAINKLKEEIIPQINQAGITFSCESIVAAAVYKQLIGAVIQGNNIVQRHNDALRGNQVTEEKGKKDMISLEEKLELYQANIFKKIWMKLKKIFPVKIKKERNPLTPEQVAQVCIDEYRKIEQRISEYNLRDNIVHAIVKVIYPEHKEGFKFMPDYIPMYMDTQANPQLEKLGLGDLIPLIEEQLIEEYRKNGKEIPDFEGYKQKKIVRQEMNLQTKRQGQYQDAIRQETVVMPEDGTEPSDD